MNQPSYHDYCARLSKSAFSGEIRQDYATRLSVATDNSVYQVIPEAVLFPKSTDDIQKALQLANDEKFQSIQFSPRGGGTGTNGQSLSSGIIIDCSKYLCEIVEFNREEQWVRVQPGVILDQLNDFLRPHGMHFAPEISPSNRATLGGMINTDACGNGSKMIGRTSDYVIDLTCVLADGTVVHTSAAVSPASQKRQDLIQNLNALLTPHQALIQEKFIRRPRNLSGYNLLKTGEGNHLNLNYLLCGSEGTLAIVTEAKLKLTPIPKHKKLILIKYKDFAAALNAHDLLEIVKPNVIEAIDEKLLSLARLDPLYFQIQEMLDGEVRAGAINLVEFSGDNEQVLEDRIALLYQHDTNALGFYQAKNSKEIKLLWELRKKSVGLISKKQVGTRRPIPFIEDTAVPPENLAGYIAAFKTLLDQHKLEYGMYGHVDAGCVHVRPALDLKLAQDERLFRELSNEVVALLEKFGGVMWGEHGMGFRCHYAEHFFGETLYEVVRRIKTLFDPKNKLNPGKIATPIDGDHKLVEIDGPWRAKVDKQVAAELQTQFPTVMACNGNGGCFTYATAETMCPSYKVTKDRVHSPKGRAVLMKEWLRIIGNKLPQQSLFSKEVYAAMNGCLSCKACATQCPLNVDVPDFKARFLFQYHKTVSRPLRDYLIASLEKFAPVMSQFSTLVNWMFRKRIAQFLFKKIFRLVQLPEISSLTIKKRQHPFYYKHAIVPPYVLMTEAEKKNAVILLQDSFTSFYEEDTAIKIYDFLTDLGIKVFVLPFFPNGKPLHVKGFLDRFEKTARQNIFYLSEIAKSAIPMIGIDPSITLTYRDEYQKIIGNDLLGFEVKLIQEWLVDKLATLNLKPATNKKEYYLLSHCTEKTACVQSEKEWQKIFAAFGLTLTPLAVGCCGMAGSYGHELEHVAYSKTLFAMDWERFLRDNPSAEKVILATGYSCRSQAKRFAGVKLQHPIAALKDIYCQKPPLPPS